jgi:hypothetical protein
MVMVYDFSHCKGSSAFSYWEAVSAIEEIIWNKLFLMEFETCL